MALSLTHLDQRTRDLMIEEIDLDVRNGSLYISTRLSPVGIRDYPDLLKFAARMRDDSELATQLAQNFRINPTYLRRKPKGGFTVVAMNRDAHETLAVVSVNWWKSS